MAHFEVVHSNFNFTRYDNLLDIPNDSYICIVKKEEGYHCRTYSLYTAEIVDKSGAHSSVNYNGYVFSEFSIKGNASNYCLDLPYKTILGVQKKREFRSDLSSNHSGEGYSRIKKEWDISSQYKDLFGFFDNLLKYGEESYELILNHEREAYANDAAYRQERDRFEAYRKETERYKECVKELYIPEGWTEIPYGFSYSYGIERVFIPSSITYMTCVPDSSTLKMVFCRATVPPRIGDTRWLSDHGVHLYVPKDSVRAYSEDPYWSQAFSIIKGI